MDVFTLPLVSGQEIVFQLLEVDEQFITVESPLVFQVVAHPETGQPMQAFGEWPALRRSTEKRVQIPISAILSAPVQAREEVERSYIASTTGLQLPPTTPKILLG